MELLIVGIYSTPLRAGWFTELMELLIVRISLTSLNRWFIFVLLAVLYHILRFSVLHANTLISFTLYVNISRTATNTEISAKLVLGRL